MQSAECITMRSASTAPCRRAILDTRRTSRERAHGTDRFWHQQINWRALRATFRPVSTTRNTDLSVSVGAMQASENSPTMHPFDSDQNWRTALGFIKSDWEGYCGTWTRLSAEGGTDAKVLREFKGLRTFRDLGDEKYEHINVYSMDVGDCEKRDVDANFGKAWSYSKEKHNTTEGWCHPFMTAEGPFRGRVLAPSPGRSISVTFSLPLEELKEGVERISPVFAGEFFLRSPGNKRRWSGSPMYSTETGKPLVMYYIYEQTTQADPNDAVDYEALEIPSARPPLGPSPADWLEGTWTGKVELIRWEADGRMQHVLESTVESFELPRTDSEYILSLLPDSMYFSYPAQLPMKGADMPPEGLTFQMGGFVALDGSTFRREMSHYGQDGRIEYVRFEEWNKH